MAPKPTTTRLQKSTTLQNAAPVSSIICSWLPMLFFIFGGCCTNVFTFEKILAETPQATHLITFVQFLFISIEGLYQNFDAEKGTLCRLFLKQNTIPLRRWLLHVVFFFVTSNLNNYAVSLPNISIPIHVILRSSGTIFTMILGGLFFGKKYNRYQIISGVALTAGLVLTTVGNSRNKSPNAMKESPTDFITSSNGFLRWNQACSMLAKGIASINLGILLLLLASVLISINGFLTEYTFKVYPTTKDTWKEGLFYQHFLALPFFLLFRKQIYAELNLLWQRAPNSVGYLLANVATQYVCARGVNHLSSQTSSLTVSVVLLLRKFTSLLLSIVIFNNSLNEYCWIGTGLIFLGAFLYSYGGSYKSKVSSGKKEK